MKKKIFFGFLALVLIMTVTAAQTIGEDSAPEGKSLSLSQAIELALKENHLVELAALGVEKAELAVDQAEFAKEKMEKNIDKGYVRKDQNSAMVIDVVPKQVQSGKIIADTAQNYALNSIKYGVEAAYYVVLQAEKMLEVSQASYKRSEEQMKQAQARFKTGLAAKMDMVAAEAQLKSAEAAVNEAEAVVKTAKMSLNQTLGLNLDTPLTLTDKFDFKAAEVVDTDLVFQEMTEKDLTYVSAREEYNSSLVNFNYYKKHYTSNTFMYRDAEYQYKKAETELESAKTTLELNIKTAYLVLKTAEENYHVLTKSLEQAEEAYRLNKLRYEVGMATNYDVLNADTAMKQAEMELLNALYNFNLAKAKFTYGVFGM